jgi:hypothetical protein
LALPELPAWLKEIDHDIRRRISSAAGGVPDVVGWNEDDPQTSARFIECKAIGETIKESQQDWVTDAISNHFAPLAIRRSASAVLAWPTKRRQR